MRKRAILKHYERSDARLPGGMKLLDEVFTRILAERILRHACEAAERIAVRRARAQAAAQAGRGWLKSLARRTRRGHLRSGGFANAGDRDGYSDSAGYDNRADDFAAIDSRSFDDDATTVRACPTTLQPRRRHSKR
jgi:hypothetical protein